MKLFVLCGETLAQNSLFLAVALETSTDSLLFDTVPLSRQELADAILHADERQLDFFGRMFSCMKACF